MTSTPLRPRLISGLLLAVALVFAVPATQAQDQESERKTKQTAAMSQKVYEELTAVQELVEAKNYTEAAGKLQDLQQRPKLTPYEKAQVWNLTGYSYYLQERYEDAIGAYEQVLKQEDLPEALMLSVLKTKAQLQFTVENYQGALETIQDLMTKVAEPSADIYMLLGQAYFQLGDYKKALDPIKTAVDMYQKQGNTPNENWLLLLRVCYYELGDYPNMIKVLEQLIQYYPKDTYLLTMAGAYSELGQTKKQLAIVEALYDKGYITSENHIVNLANLFLLHEAPVKAARLLEKEIAAGHVKADERNLRLLSQAWYTAREDEKSIPPLEQAAKLAEDGELYIRLAQSYINLQKWSEAAKAIEQGLKMGSVNREDQAEIMLGMALFNQKKYDLARKAFEKALPDKRSRHTAQQWIAYVDSEVKRAELLSKDKSEL